MKAKGSMILNMVKVIRSNKDKNWEKWLTPEDMEIVNSNVLTGAWYPGETFYRMGLALLKEISGSDLEVSRGFGKLMARSMETLYKNIMVQGDPAATLEKFSVIQGTFMKDTTGESQVTENGPNWLKYKLTVEDKEIKELDNAAIEAFFYLIAGTLEQLVEMTGGKKPELTMDKRPDGYEYHIKWQ